MPGLTALNRLSFPEAAKEFFRCCGSPAWAEQMAKARPFESEAHLYSVAQRLWEDLDSAQWLEAFKHHPRIGEKTSQSWAKEEQAGTKTAARTTLEALERGNVEYEQKFGHVYLVCATGKTAEEMLSLLNSRLGNTPEREIEIAAGEQSKITRLRLEKLLKS